MAAEFVNISFYIGSATSDGSILINTEIGAQSVLDFYKTDELKKMFFVRFRNGIKMFIEKEEGKTEPETISLYDYIKDTWKKDLDNNFSLPDFESFYGDAFLL